MAVQRVSRGFKDISLSFNAHPITKDIPVLKNERAIIRSVRNLVETIPTERFFSSDIGSNVRSSLFNFVDFGTAEVIKAEIESVVDNYEPRVENLEVYVNPMPDDNSFEVLVAFDIVGQQFPTQEFSFLLEATR